MRLAVRLTPRARDDRIDGILRMPEGGRVLKVSVTAPPAENRANSALLRLVARAFDLRQRDVAIIGGGKNRNKIVRIVGDPVDLLRRLGAVVSGLPEL